MENKTKKNILVNYTVIAAIIALLFPLAGLFFEFITNNEMDYTLSGIFSIYKDNPAQIILLSFIIIIPLSVFIYIFYFTDRFFNIEEQISKEKSRKKELTSFTQKLMNNDFDADLTLYEDNDLLKRALIDLRDTLKDNTEKEQKRRDEDEKSRWVAEGFAKFGDILRNNSDNMEALAFNMIKELSNYINCIQGSFYLLDEETSNDKYFNQIALFAYDRKKYADSKIKWGEGLVGTCAQEGKTIYLTKVPENYVSVTSGLGKANPRSILIVPLISEESLHGVMEFASLSLIEEFQINFLERVAENVASTIANVKMNEKTAKLLDETKQQTQALSAQEEEMRQNMEELQATQEELSRQAERFVKLENTVNHTMIRAEFDTEGILLYANTKFLNKLEYTANSDVEGKSIYMFISEKDRKWFSEIWEDLMKGGRHFEGYMKHITKTGKDLWTMATYTCIRSEDNEVERILFLAIDTTEQKMLDLKLEGIVDAINRSALMIEFNSTGNILGHNENFNFIFDYKEKEVSELTVFDLISSIDIDTFNNKWDAVLKGIGFQGQFQVNTRGKETKWIRGGFSAVYDMYSDVSRVVFVGNDITIEKNMENNLRENTETLKKQEQLLRKSEKELSNKLRAAKVEMQKQYAEIEKIKNRNEITLEGALDAIITTSGDNKIIFFNRAAEEMFGFAKYEVIGHDIEMLFSNSYIEEDEFIAKYTGPGNNKIIGKRKEVKIRTKDGKDKPVLILLSKAQVENENTYTAFIQNIEVELF